MCDGGRWIDERQQDRRAEELEGEGGALVGRV